MAETIFSLGLRRREPFLRAMAFPRQMASSPRFCGPSLPHTRVLLLTLHQAATTAPAGVSRTQGAGR
eukprot:COSAG01_NODE_1791_length_9221_cov_7.677373_6_plen_67_part_00